MTDQLDYVVLPDSSGTRSQLRQNAAFATDLRAQYAALLVEAQQDDRLQYSSSDVVAIQASTSTESDRCGAVAISTDGSIEGIDLARASTAPDTGQEIAPTISTELSPALESVVGSSDAAVDSFNVKQSSTASDDDETSGVTGRRQDESLSSQAPAIVVEQPELPNKAGVTAATTTTERDTTGQSLDLGTNDQQETYHPRHCPPCLNQEQERTGCWTRTPVIADVPASGTVCVPSKLNLTATPTDQNDVVDDRRKGCGMHQAVRNDEHTTSLSNDHVEALDGGESGEVLPPEQRTELLLTVSSSQVCNDPMDIDSADITTPSLYATYYRWTDADVVGSRTAHTSEEDEEVINFSLPTPLARAAPWSVALSSLDVGGGEEGYNEEYEPLQLSRSGAEPDHSAPNQCDPSDAGTFRWHEEMLPQGDLPVYQHSDLPFYQHGGSPSYGKSAGEADKTVQSEAQNKDAEEDVSKCIDQELSFKSTSGSVVATPSTSETAEADISDAEASGRIFVKRWEDIGEEGVFAGPITVAAG